MKEEVARLIVKPLNALGYNVEVSFEYEDFDVSVSNSDTNMPQVFITTVKLYNSIVIGINIKITFPEIHFEGSSTFDVRELMKKWNNVTLLCEELSKKAIKVR